MARKKFHLLDILSITDGRLLSPSGMDAVYKILNFMTQDDLFTHQLPRASDECRPYLLKQHPKLDCPEMQYALGELTLMLDTESGKKEPQLLINGWLHKILDGEYKFYIDEMLEIETIPENAHQFKNPMEELLQMVPPEKIITVNVSETTEAQNDDVLDYEYLG